jgi:hypothetical protein
LAGNLQQGKGTMYVGNGTFEVGYSYKTRMGDVTSIVESLVKQRFQFRVLQQVSDSAIAGLMTVRRENYEKADV